MSKLLFAIFSAGKLSVTYVDTASETQVRDADATPEVLALEAMLTQAAGVPEIKGFQIFGLEEFPAEEEGGEAVIQGQHIEVLHLDGTNVAIGEPTEELAAARDALRLQLAALIE